MASKLTLLCALFFLFSITNGNDTIKSLQGCQKGSKVQGLHNLKLYLARFGYLNYQHTPNYVNSDKNDEFDEELEAALKDYQTFYHINATGVLDEPTVLQMLKPRCGQPDKKSSHNHETKLLHIVPHYRFFGMNLRWPPSKRHLTYAFNSNFPTNGIPPVARAFNTWAHATQYFTFSKVSSVTSADLKISWERGNHGDGVPFAGMILAHAFAPTDGRLHFNADVHWSVGPRAYTYDIETTALHEIGHLLGLDHSQFENSIMWSVIGMGVAKGLNQDDLQGIKVLYGV